MRVYLRTFAAKVVFLVAAAVVLSAVTQAQSQLVMTALAPPAPVGGGAVVGGQTGGATVFYWVIARYPIGTVASAPIQVQSTFGPQNFNATNYVQVTWSPLTGATGYDVVRSITSLLPNGCAACAVVLNTAATTVSDQGGGSAFTLGAGALNATGVINLNNVSEARPYAYIQFNGGSPFRFTPLNGAYVVGNCPQFGALGTIVDSGSTTCGGIANGVTSFNTRTGAVTFVTGDLPNAGVFTGDAATIFPALTIANAAITAVKMINGGVFTGDAASTFPVLTIANAAITAAKMINGGVFTGDATSTFPALTISNTAITAAKMVNSGVFTGDAASTFPALTLANNAVTAVKMVNAGVFTGDVLTTFPAVTVSKVNGVSYSATAPAHSVEVITTANTTATSKVVPDCTDTGGNHLNFTQSTDAFSCGTSSAGGAASPYPTVTDAAPIAWNLGSATITNGIVTLNHLTATRALNITNPVNGGFYTLVVKQDATGGALLTLGTGCTWKVANGGTGAVVLTAAASAIDILGFSYDGTNCYAVLQDNFN